MRHTILLCCLVIVGCSSAERPLPDPIDVKGEWTADFLLNTSTASPGKEQNNFGDLSLAAGKYDSRGVLYVGDAVLSPVAFAAQGSLQDPTLDDQGQILYELVGNLVYRGTWEASAYEGETSFVLDVHCEELKLTVNRPDLQGVCGDPFPIGIYSRCERPDGATTIDCAFDSGDVVFHRK